MKFRFLDSLRNFLPKEEFHHMNQFYPSDKVDPLLRKGIYLYDYTDNLDKCRETCLPS